MLFGSRFIIGSNQLIFFLQGNPTKLPTQPCDRCGDVRIYPRFRTWNDYIQAVVQNHPHHRHTREYILLSSVSLNMRHTKFIARTIFVNQNNVEEACRVLNRILGKEEFLDQFRRTRTYEKPFLVQYIFLYFSKRYSILGSAYWRH